MEKLLGFTVWDQSVDDLVDSIIKEAKLHQPLSIRNAPQTNPYHHQYEVPACLYASCINPHSYCEAQTDFIFKDALQHSTWLIPDGVGITRYYWL